MKTILVIDDNIELLETIGLMLEAGDLNSVCVSETERALALIHEVNFDLILSDLHIPAQTKVGEFSPLGGLEVVCKTTESYPALPVLVMSGCIEAKTMSTLKNFGVSDFIEKPFEMDDLLDKVFPILNGVGEREVRL